MFIFYNSKICRNFKFLFLKIIKKKIEDKENYFINYFNKLHENYEKNVRVASLKF